MGRPEQHGKGKRSPAHEGKHGGEIVGDRCEGGAFAKGNKAAHAKRTSQAMRMRNKLREIVGEEGIRKCTDALMDMATNDKYEPKERIAAIKVILEYALGKSSSEVVVASETDGNGAQRMVFAVRSQDGEEIEL